MAKNHGPTVKDDKQYEELRKQGASKEKAGLEQARSRSGLVSWTSRVARR